nr:hypothetical protein [Tanacetum cinerariifolium]
MVAYLEKTKGNSEFYEIVDYLTSSTIHHALTRLSMKKRFGKKEFESKQGRKKDKPEPTLDDSTFDGLDADLDVDHGIDYMDTEELVNEGRLSEETKDLKLITDTEEIAQDKGSGEKGGSTKELVNTARPEDSTVRPDVGTTDPIAPSTTKTTKLQHEEREEYTIKERAKFLAETIAAQRRFRAAQRSADIRRYAVLDHEHTRFLVKSRR